MLTLAVTYVSIGQNCHKYTCVYRNAIHTCQCMRYVVNLRILEIRYSMTFCTVKGCDIWKLYAVRLFQILNLPVGFLFEYEKYAQW